MTKIDQAKQILEKVENQEFIRKHLKSNTTKLFFKFQNNPEKRFLIEQVAARQVIKKKLPSFYHNPQLYLPPRINIEQSSSEETARLKASFFKGNSFCDLTGGLGIDFLHFSKNFEQSTYVEPQKELFDLVSYNLSILKKPYKGLNASAEASLAKIENQDLIYIDPSRRPNSIQKEVMLQNYLPNVIELNKELVKKAKDVLIKTSPMIGIDSVTKILSGLCQIWVISVRNECKEVLFKLSENGSNSIKIKTWNSTTNGLQYFESSIKEKSKPSLGEAEQYIYEPNSSILKAGLSDTLAKEFELKKLHPNSNFFTHQNLKANYPGKIFQVLGIHKPFDKSLRNKRFNVISRNYPEKASTIESKLKLKPSDGAFLLATQNLKSKIFIRAKIC